MKESYFYVRMPAFKTCSPANCFEDDRDVEEGKKEAMGRWVNGQ